MRGRSAAAVALSVSSPRHLSAGSLPLPGPQSLSLIVLWGAPNCPGWRGGEENDHPENHLEGNPTLRLRSLEAQGPGQVRPSRDCASARALAPGRVTARSLSGLAAPRTCAVPRPPGRLCGTRGDRAAHQLGGMPGIIPAHASPWLAQPR